MKRHAWILIVGLTFSAFAPATGGPAMGAPALFRIERRTEADLALLTRAGIPIVGEMNPCLFMAGGPEEVAKLRDRGYDVTVLETDASTWEYLIVGLRPDSDVESVERLGTVLLAEENWVLLRVEPGTPVEAIAAARVFVSRLPLEPVLPPRIPPESAGSGTAAMVGAAVPLVQQIVDSISTAQIDQYWNDLTSNPPTGTRYSTSQGGSDAATYCFDTYAGLHLPAQYQHWDPSHAPNVIATHEGAVHPENVYIVIGHLDDLPASGLAPGADDNGSGSVNVLESARLLSCYGLRNTVKFINCTGEEEGLLGSDAYAADAETRGENILGVLNFDMIGWEGDGVPVPENLDLDYNAPSQDLAQRFVAASSTYGTGLVVDAFLCPSLTASDHYSFWRRGWKATCGITDNEDYCGHGGNYPYYHTSDDTIAHNGDRSFFYSVVRTSVATLSELGEPFKITFDRSSYPCSGGALRVYVADRDLDTNPAVQESITVSVWSDTETVPEEVVLTEQGTDSMIFSGTIATTSAPAAHGDGLLSVSPGDSVNARYTDALDCNGATGVDYTATGRIDCTPPAISAVGVTGVTDTQATVSWTTDEAANGVVVYGTSTPPSVGSPTGPQGSSHQITLTGLQSCTVYWYEVHSTDDAGNLAVDANAGRWYHFETLGDFGSGLQPCHAGRVTLDRTRYGCSATVTARLVDIDLNRDSNAIETAIVQMTSGRESAPETLVLAETGPSTSTFTGTIQTDPGPVAHDGKLQATDGDLITASYHDVDDGTGRAAVTFATATVDCAGPAMSGLAVSDQPPGRVVVSWSTDEPATARLDWGTTSSLGKTVDLMTLSPSHSAAVGGLNLCGTYYFKITNTDEQGNSKVEDRAGALYQFQAGAVPGLLLYDSFENSSGWVLDPAGEWQIGPPLAKGAPTGGPDPSIAWGGGKVLGNDLSGTGANPGAYEPSLASSIAESPTMNARSLSSVKLMFRRWLGVEGSYADKARVLVYKNGWSAVWTNDQFSSTYDGAWVQQSLDISSFAAGNHALKVGFSIASNATNQYCGWNIDDVVVKDGTLPDSAVCGGCTNKPSFAGLGSATDLAACGDTGIALSWPAAASWGSGGPGTYSVYRDTIPNFTPTSSNRIATGLTLNGYTDATAPNGQPLYYLVRAENNETCGTGPNNGGVVDDNTSYASAIDSVSQPAPGDVGASVMTTTVAGTHVRLAWSAAPGAASYRVYRADNPQMTGAIVAGTTSAIVFDDVGEATGSISRFYLVKAVNACGVESP